MIERTANNGLMHSSTDRYHATGETTQQTGNTSPPAPLIEIAELALSTTNPHRLVELACRLVDMADPDMTSALIDEEGQRITAAFLEGHAVSGWGWDGEAGWGDDDWDIESAVVHQLDRRLNEMASTCARAVMSRADEKPGEKDAARHGVDTTSMLMRHLLDRLRRSSLPGYRAV